MPKATDWPGDLNDLINNYRYQPALTPLLDALGEHPFDQKIVNEIVLWKLDRYAQLNNETLSLLDSATSVPQGEHRTSVPVLNALLSTRGVALPMASALLRFRNPNAFQIIDRHAYRAVYLHPYPLSPTSSPQRQIETYFTYLDDVLQLCRSRNVDFRVADRVLYEFDKQENGPL